MQCPNCAALHEGDFCGSCGQSNVDLHVPIGDLLREAVEEALGLDSRLRHTVVPFLFRPGEVTRDYLSGRRVRYASPLKMYIIASVIFFFAFSRHSSPNLVQIDASDRAESGRAPEARGRVGQFFQERLRRLAAKGPDEASRELAAGMLDTLPKAMIALLPIFALLLKLLWRRRFYAEHLVFALHYHAFALILLTPGGLLPGAAGRSATEIALVIAVVYLFLALRRVYGDSFRRTLAKLLALGVAYSALLLLGIAAAALVSLAFL